MIIVPRSLSRSTSTARSRSSQGVHGGAAWSAGLVTGQFPTSECRRSTRTRSPTRPRTHDPPSPATHGPAAVGTLAAVGQQRQAGLLVVETHRLWRHVQPPPGAARSARWAASGPSGPDLDVHWRRVAAEWLDDLNGGLATPRPVGCHGGHRSAGSHAEAYGPCCGATRLAQMVGDRVSAGHRRGECRGRLGVEEVHRR